MTLHPTQTLEGVAYPPMSSAPASEVRLHPAAPTTLADATPIYSDRDSTIPPPTPQVAAAPGDGYVAGICTVPIIALI